MYSALTDEIEVSTPLPPRWTDGLVVSWRKCMESLNFAVYSAPGCTGTFASVKEPVPRATFRGSHDQFLSTVRVLESTTRPHVAARLRPLSPPRSSRVWGPIPPREGSSTGASDTQSRRSGRLHTRIVSTNSGAKVILIHCQTSPACLSGFHKALGDVSAVTEVS